jgi:hypothetical protein
MMNAHLLPRLLCTFHVDVSQNQAFNSVLSGLKRGNDSQIRNIKIFIKMIYT